MSAVNHAHEARRAYEEVVEGPHRLTDPHAAEWERNYSLFTHLTLLVVALPVFPIPVIPALIMWLIKRNDSPFIDDHGREAINFQLSMTIYMLVLVPLAGVITCGLGFLLWIPVYVVGVVGMVTAAIAANKGQYYRYPATIRFLH